MLSQFFFIHIKLASPASIACCTARVEVPSSEACSFSNSLNQKTQLRIKVNKQSDKSLSQNTCTPFIFKSHSLKAEGLLLREAFNKKKHSFNGIFHKGWGVQPFSITFFRKKHCFPKNIQRCSKASNSSRNVKT